MPLFQDLLNIPVFHTKKICASDVDKSKTGIFKKKFNINILENKDLVKNSHFVIIAVKPKDIPGLCLDISPYLNRNSIVVSVAAGITIDSIRKNVRKKNPCNQNDAKSRCRIRKRTYWLL